MKAETNLRAGDRTCYSQKFPEFLREYAGACNGNASCMTDAWLDASKDADEACGTNISSMWLGTGAN